MNQKTEVEITTKTRNVDKSTIPATVTWVEHKQVGIFQGWFQYSGYNADGIEAYPVALVVFADGTCGEYPTQQLRFL